MKKIVIGAALAMACFAGAEKALAAPLAPASSLVKENETLVFAGLQWNFGSSRPEFVVGVRASRSDRESRVTGLKFDIAIPLDSIAWKTPTLRVMGLAGNCDVQAEAGLGWTFASNKPLLALGVQAPFSTLGVNYAFGHSLSPYAGVNSLRKPACAFQAAVRTPV